MTLYTTYHSCDLSFRGSALRTSGIDYLHLQRKPAGARSLFSNTSSLGKCSKI